LNWLAHLYLSEPTPEFRLGNLLPDLVPARALTEFPPAFQEGIRRHRRIDAFTDTHPLFRQSIRRLGPEYRRYGGVLVDMFYDHILAREWDSMASQPLPEFAAEVYASFEAHLARVPPEARYRLLSMRSTNWLCAYRELEGIRLALSRIGSHLRRPIDLGLAVTALEREYERFHEDFREFFPQLAAHVVPVETRTNSGH
jgi:acyl carrier protein phosphodiesterase